MSLEFRSVSYMHPGDRSGGVSDVSFQVGRGELVALMGPSGSGKSTLLQLAAGFLEPRLGTIWLGATELTRTPAVERDFGVVFQAYALFPHMSIAENVEFPLRARGVPRLERSRRVLETLARVGLADLADRRPESLSGGQQQRAALARAIVFDPRALLLDEPLSAVDGRLRQSLRDEIKAIQAVTDAPCLLVTHDAEDALSIADRVAVLVDGRLRQIGTPAEVYDRPVDATVARFTGPVNAIEAVALDAHTVRTAAGSLRCDHGRAVGTTMTLLLRPERIHLSQSPDAEPANRLVFESVDTVRVGGMFESHGRIAKLKVMARSFERPSTQTNWTVPPDAIWAVDPERFT